MEIQKKSELSDINNNIEKKNGDDIIKKSFSDEEYRKGETKYGITPEKLSIMYYKTSFGIQKKQNKQKKFLFEIWENGIGDKKNKINCFDALNHKNLENILLELTETNIYDD